MPKRGNHFAHSVLERDKVCQICGASENLQAHHIIPFSEGGADTPENGITLCSSCHADQHPDQLRSMILKDIGNELAGIPRKDPEMLSDKKLITIRISPATKDKMTMLKKHCETTTEIITMAIDLLYQSEIKQ